MKTITTLVLLFFFFSASAQTNQKFDQSFVNLTAGRSTHGTGDMKGISQKITYGKYFRKKLLWSVSVGASIHDGSLRSSTTQSDGTVLDHSFRYTAGGIQTSVGLGYSFIKTKRNELGLKVDGILRYQSSSYFDQLFIVFDPQTTGIPYPATYIINTSPQKTYAIGVSPELFYNHSIGKSLFLGATANFQADTNGDVITNLSISIGKRFN